MKLNSRKLDDFTTAEDWFAGGRRVHYDPTQKRMVGNQKDWTISVFERVRLPRYSRKLPHRETRWLTLLPGFPSGSYGFSHVDRLLEERNSIQTPRLYVEYVGQGDSDKPTTKNYAYSTMERADLVQAQWRAHGVRRTVVASFDFSSTVLMELLRRQQENHSSFTQIEHVLLVNGSLFADCQSQSWTATPLLKTPLGRMGSAMAQYSNIVLDAMLKPLYSKSYSDPQLMKRELRETCKAIRHRNGAFFLSNASGFAQEHEQYAIRWNLAGICASTTDVTIRVLNNDQLAHERLQEFYPRVQIDFGSKHLSSTSEQAPEITDRIESLTLVESS